MLEVQILASNETEIALKRQFLFYCTLIYFRYISANQELLGPNETPVDITAVCCLRASRAFDVRSVIGDQLFLS